MRRIFLILLVVSEPILIVGTKAVTRPSFLPTCYRNDPQLDRCLLDATERMRPYLARGVPELQMPSFEPFRIPEIRLGRRMRMFDFEALLENVTVHGLTKYKFTHFHFNVPTHEVFSRISFPGLVLKGDYTVTGRILMVAPIESSGTFVGKVGSSEGYVREKYEEAKLDNGKIHLSPVSINVTVTMKRKPRVKLEGLVRGDEELNAVINEAINDNIDILLEGLNPIFENAMGRIIERVLFGWSVQHIPFDELFPVDSTILDDVKKFDDQ